MKAMTIVYGAVGLLIGVYVLQAILPIFFQTAGTGLLNSNTTQSPGSFYNSSVWGSFGSAILPTVFPLILAAGVLFIVFMSVSAMIKHKGGKSGKGGYGL